MGLPDSALRKLAAEFRGANGRPRPTLRESHTLPIRRDRWNAYAQPFDELIHDFAETVAQADGLYADFAETRSWLARTTEIKRQIISMLLALAPFTYFDVDRATRLMNRLEQAVVEVAAAVEQRRRPNTDPPAVRGTQDTWAAAVDEEDDYRFGVAFGLDFDPVNEDREFQASLVLSAYRYQNSVMAAQVLPHLASLGVPRETMPNDILAGVSIVGWIVGSQDPVVAATTLDDLLGALLNPASRQVADSVLAMFAERENITRQVRRKVASSLAQIGPDQDLEQRALILADVYKSLVEGPVRQFGWALFSLESGSWSAPPTLTPMRDSLVAHGGFIGQLAEACIIPNLRNGHAHETLEWDGIQACYLAAGDSVSLARVLNAVATADGFDKGCQAALACYRALRLTPDLGVVTSDPLRMPSHERALAYFGTNGLWVARADFNASVARLRLRGLDNADINPCFQALLLARQILPRVACFEVSVEDAEGVVIGVDAAALDDTLRVWSEARWAFDKMPTSTFLPANFAARLQAETEAVAVRSISWIAADDLLSAIDGADDWLSADEILLMSKRAHLVETALTECIPRVPDRLQVRPRVVRDTARELQRELGSLSLPTPLVGLDRLNCVIRLRHFWATWGPVPRLPSVAEPAEDAHGYEAQPTVLKPPGHAYWQTL